MTGTGPSHLVRPRSSTTGCVRPIPRCSVEDLAALGPTEALDVGCGTGKVARALMEQGLRVLGVEPDASMAAVARRRGVTIELARFETWEPAGRTFDMLTAGHSWHWVVPGSGLAKAASVTKPGATVALFWNYHALDAPLRGRSRGLRGVRARAEGPRPRPDGATLIVDPFTGSDLFAPGGARTYRWWRELKRGRLGRRCWRPSATMARPGQADALAAEHATRDNSRPTAAPFASLCGTTFGRSRRARD